MNASSSIRPDVLGRLLAIPSLLDVFSDIAAIALFLQSALREVPGISDLAIDIEGVCYPASLVDAIPSVPQPPLHLARSPSPPASSPTSCRRLRLATNRQHYGDLILVIDDLDQFILYEPYVCNISNIVATVLENRAFLHNLQTTNNRLTEVLNHLEQRVQERTSLLSAEIARREVLETALRASEEKYRNLLVTTSEGFWLLDAAMNLSEVNQALCTMLGYTQAELLGKSLIDLVDEADRSMFMAQLAQVPVTDHRPYELVLITSQGNKLHTSVHATVIRSSRGDVQGSFAFITDITERKRTEANLRLSEEQRRLALDLTQLGSWDWNLLTGELIWSKQTFAIMGFAPDDPTYISWRDRVQPEDLEVIEAAIIYAQKHHTYFNCEYRLHHLDGSLHWILARGQTLCTATAQPVRMVGIVMDISNRKLAEFALQQQTQRERALNRVFQAIRQSLDLETIFATATTEIAQLLQVEQVSVAQYWPSRQCWRIVSSFHQAELTDPVGLEIPAVGNPLSDQLKQGKCIQVENTDRLTDATNRTVAQTLPGAWLLVPMMHQSTIWGCLVIHSMQRPVAWRSAQVALVQAVADQLVIAIQQANLYQQTQQELTERQRAEAALQQLNQELEQRVQERTQALKQQAEQERLLRFSIQNIHQSLDSKEILTTVLSETRQTLQVDRVSIYQFSADWSGRFVAESLEEGWNRFVGEELQPIWASTNLQVNAEERYDQNEVRVVNDIYTAELDSCYIESLEQFQLRAYVIIPIFVDDQLWGLLAACQHQGAREWQSWEITLLQQISLQLAIALRQSQLYQAAQMQVETLEKLNQLKDDFLSTVSHELRSPLASIKMAIQMLELKLSQPQTQDERLTQYIQILKTSCTQELSLINDLLDLQRLEAGKRELEIESIDLNQWLPAIIEPFATRAQEHEQQLIIELPPNLPIITTELNSLKRIVAELLHNACKYTPPGEQIKLAVWVRDDSLHMQVSNSGVELPPETLPHLFEKFYRVTGTDRWKQGGTGLGLALVKRLVEHLNGTISVNSENSLIWFTLRLPLTLQVPALLGTEGVT